MGTFISTGKITLGCNIVYAGQMIADTIIVGNEIRAENISFMPFVKEKQQYTTFAPPSLSLFETNSNKFVENDNWNQINLALHKPTTSSVNFKYCFEFYSASGVSDVYAGYDDVAAADESHTFPICNKKESATATIEASNTKATGINIKPLIDGLIETDEALWLKILDIAGAQLASNYEDELGYKIYIVNSDKSPTATSALVIDVNEDATHAFTKSEFKFQHATQTFASVIITGLPTTGSLTYNGKAVTKDQQIAVADLGKLMFSPKANEFGNKYSTFKYKVVGSGTNNNTSVEYTATVNVTPVNDKPTVADAVFTVNELDHVVAGGPIVVTDVSNERNVDTYTYSTVTVSGSDYAAFNNAFEITKLSNQNATIKVKSDAVLNYSTKNSYVVYATVTDNAATETTPVADALTSAKFKITVNVKNENDAPTIGNQAFIIAEKQPDGSDWPSGTSIGKVTTASDPDGDQLTYSIVTTGVPFKFKNGSNELVITDGSVLDYETKPTWTIKVQVEDGELSATATITVNLTDVNEASDPFALSKEYSIEENSATGTSLGTFTVFDQDASDVLTYTLTGALTGAAGSTGKTLSDLFTLKETANKNGIRTVSINVKNSELLDYETLYNSKTKNATYPATITITDKASNSVSKTTNISITDVNEPHIAKGGTFYLQEHSGGATPVCAKPHSEGVCNAGYGRVVGTDPDIYNTTYSTLTFKISENNTGDNAIDAKNFTIDNQGLLKTDADAKFEYDGEDAQHEYNFYVTVSDFGFTQDVLVTVNIENIVEPEIVVVADGEVGVREDAKVNDNVSAITFKMLADAGIICNVDEDRINCENEDDKEKCEIHYAADKEACGILDLEIGDVKQDGKSSSIGNSIFGVEEYGVIYIKNTKNLDYEALSPNNKFTVSVVAKRSGSANDVTIDRTVVVTDVNEVPVSRDTVFKDILETLAGGDSVGTLWATDPDSCSHNNSSACKNGLHPYKFNKLNFAIVDDGSDLPFEINQSSGEITLKQSEELNYIKQKQYKFTVKISDRSQDPVNPPLATSANVTININDVNKPSKFEVLSDLYEIDENVSTGTELDGNYIVVYDDDDADVNNLKITITDDDGTNADKLFKVVQIGKTDTETHLTTFIIKSNTDNLDYEALYKSSKKGAVFNVTLSIIDDEGLLTTKKTVLRVNDVNEEPRFANTSYAFSISENVATETSLGDVEAVDPDIYTPTYATLYYSLEGDEAAPFDIDPSTGEISTISNAQLDYETKKKYEFYAVVTDKKCTKKVPVTITVTDFGEAPKFHNVPELSVDENSLKGTKVGVVTAEDDDCKNSSTCTKPVYSLIASEVAANDYKSFTIDATTGTITVAANNSLNYEVKNEYSVRVVATDGDDPTLADFVDLTIVINDVNEAPTFEEKEYAFNVHENAPMGEFIGSVAADDEDTWGKLTYILSDYESGTNDSAAFKISDGKIYLNTNSLNYEKKKQYQVWAKATDNGKSYGTTINRTDFSDSTAITLVTINVIDAPEPPVIVDDNKDINVNENTAEEPITNTEIACYEIQDEDAGQTATLTGYLKDAGKNNADLLFEANVKKKDGVYNLCLDIKDTSKIDYETMDHVYSVYIGVVDEDNLKTEIKKTINIIDVNEAPIISGDLELSLYEDKGKGYALGKLVSEDIDTSKAFTQNVFKAIGGDTASFSITEDGKIITKRNFDYEKEKSKKFGLIVALSDEDSKTYPKLKTTATVTITLKDVPESPEITSTEFAVYENAVGGTLVGVLQALDPDGDTDLLFSLTEDNSYVTVSSTGEIKMLKGAKIDFEKMQKFTINVSVKDVEGMSSKKDIVINVIDVNESPIIKPQTFTVAEDADIGTLIGTLKATDTDTKNSKFSNLKFYAVKEDKAFDITQDGYLVINEELDYESDSTYVVKVYVTDGEFCDTTDITIKVGNVIEKSVVEITSAVVGGKTYPYPKNLVVNANKILVEWEEDGRIRSSLDTLKEGTVYIIKTYHNPTRDISGADTVIVTYDPTASEIGEIDPSSSSSSSAKDSDKSSSSKKASSSSSSEDSEPDSSSSKGSGFKNKHFHVRMTGAFEFAIVMDEDLPSLAKQYVVMDMKGQVLSTGELSNKDTRVTVPTSGSYIVKVGLGYRRVNIQK
jgi:hypothetical protein